MEQVSEILNAIGQGDPQAAEQLLPVVYNDLRKLAEQKLAQEKPGQTLQATALVHEAYLRLVGSSEQQWDHRGHFFSAAAEAMRRILIENARRKQAQKRGGDWNRLDVNQAELVVSIPLEDLLTLDDALHRLEEESPMAAKVVNLRYFAGLTLEEVAATLEVSRKTVTRYWALARAWLYKETGGEVPQEGES